MGEDRERVGGTGTGRGAMWAGLIVGTAALVPRLMTASHDLLTTDENVWRMRTDRFGDAVLSGRFGDASASLVSGLADGEAGTAKAVATMPGVVPMWLGVMARGVWSVGRGLGLWAGSDSTFVESPSGLNAAQAAVAVFTSVLVGVLVILVARWLGLLPAVVSGLLVATEPFLVAHGAVFHTDELVALCGVTGLVACALAFGLPHRTPWRGRPLVAGLAGALLAGAVLTKLSGVVLLVPAALLVVWAAVAAVRARAPDVSPWAAVGWLRSTIGWLVGVAVAVALVSYPALWADPAEELRLLNNSANLADTGHIQFFLGEPTEHPGPAYYFVALPLRVTPWFLVAGVAAGALLWARAASRGTALALAIMAVPYMVAISAASKQFDRYGLPVLVVGALAIGAAAPVVVAAVRKRIGTDEPWSRRQLMFGRAVGGLLVVHAVVVAPWGIAYFNPLLGGAETAERAILVGWGEEYDATEIVTRHRRGDCDGVTVAGFAAVSALGCGTPAIDWDTADYVALYIAERQRMPDDDERALVRGRPLVGEHTVQGIIYLQVYGPRR